MSEENKYTDNQLTWLKLYMEAEFKSVRQAVETYNNTNNEWKDGHNRLQQQMKEQGSTFVTRKELWLGVLAIATIVISAVAILLKKG